MVFLALSLIGRAINGASVEGAAMKRPKTYSATPKEHRQTANWVLHYTNRAREKHKLPPLRRYLTLESAAQKHSNWMARNRRFFSRGTSGKQAARENICGILRRINHWREHIPIYGEAGSEKTRQEPGRWVDEKPRAQGQHFACWVQILGCGGSPFRRPHLCYSKLRWLTPRRNKRLSARRCEDPTNQIAGPS